jgi:hypothetical protein
MTCTLTGTVKRLKSAAKYRIKQAILAANYRLGNYREAFWLIGDGRSGTTWVADLVSHQMRYRQLFEPFHPQMVSHASFLRPHQYMRPDATDERLQDLAADVFSGRFAHRHVDSVNRAFAYRGLVVKDIFANLFAYWASLRFPAVKVILLIRNPFAIAVSKSRRKNWYWLTEPLDLFAQHDLRDDFIGPFEDTIRETSATGNYLLNQVLIWAITNYVPLRQFGPDRLHVTFYEDVYANPNREVAGILAFARPALAMPHVDIDPDVIARPSWVSGSKSTLAQERSPITSWKHELSTRDIDAGLKILERFGLAELYDDQVQPKREILQVIRERI